MGQLPIEFVQTIVEAALATVGGAVWRVEEASVMCSLQVGEDILLDTLFLLLTAVATSVQFFILPEPV